MVVFVKAYWPPFFGLALAAEHLNLARKRYGWINVFLPLICQGREGTHSLLTLHATCSEISSAVFIGKNDFKVQRDIYRNGMVLWYA